MELSKSNELVLVFKDELMYGFEGLLPEDYPNSLYVYGVSTNEKDLRWLNECCFRSFFRPRGLVETNPTYKQVIPYIVITTGDHVFTYQRDGTESRLSKKISIGIGGHVNNTDFKIGGTLVDAMNDAAYREFFEEVSLGDTSNTARRHVSNYLKRPAAVLYAGKESDMVNHVHFGAVYIVKVQSYLAAGMTLLEEGTQLDWMSVSDLKDCDDLEEWSKLVVAKCL